jgi:hypothetical protein
MGSDAAPAGGRYCYHSLNFLKVFLRVHFGNEFLKTNRGTTMAWIRTVPMEDADESLQKAMADQRALYPVEYAQPVQELDQGLPGIVASHTLIPQALHHAFATFGALMSPDLPLERRQHEMIATMVSLTNKCHY